MSKSKMSKTEKLVALARQALKASGRDRSELLAETEGNMSYLVLGTPRICLAAYTSPGLAEMVLAELTRE